MFASLSGSIGIDLSNPESWTHEAVKLVQQNKEKFRQAMEWMPVVEECVGVFLEMQVSKAELYARICKGMFSAKKRVDKASASMLSDYFSYLKHGERLSNQLQRKQQLMEKRDEMLQNVQEDNLSNAIAYLNTTAQLSSQEGSHALQLNQSSAEKLAEFRNEKRNRRSELKTSHLQVASK